VIRWMVGPRRGRRLVRAYAGSALLCAAFVVAPTEARSEGSVLGSGGLSSGPTAWGEFRLGAAIDLAFRDSQDVRFKLNHPFPPDFIPPGQTAVYLETPSSGGSFEVANVELSGSADFTPDVAAHVVVRFIDRYDQNPSSNDQVLVREAWLRLGTKLDTLEPADGTTWFAVLGRASRFSRPPARALESWGLWDTAVGRFEEDQLQVGGTLGQNLYWRASIANGNPLFFRDPNALAGDNGTPQRVPGHVDPNFQSGFPILYDTLPSAVNFDGRFEYGAGVGTRFVTDDRKRGIDLLGWYFQRQLDASAPIDGSFYGGDLDLLSDDLNLRLPYQGTRKLETGANLVARLDDLRLFGQFVYQDIADLPRQGFELEASYRFHLDGLFASGDMPVFNWVAPAFRFSNIDSRYRPPKGFVAPSTAWDWRKYDIGARIGVIRGIDFTVEYARNDAVLFSGKLLHPDELLTTVHIAL